MPPLALAFASDLHLEVSGCKLDAAGADVVVAAGDILGGGRGDTSPVRWLAQQCPDVPVIFVPGNHDFEGLRRQEAIDRWRRHAEGTQVHVLINDRVTLGGVDFLGTPLWSNFKLFGREYQEEIEKDAGHYVCDFSNNYDDAGRPWTPAWMREEHERCRSFLDTHLHKVADPDRPQIVVTHFAPHRNSLHPRFYKPAKPRESRLSAYWVNDCTGLLRRATGWIHGHTHDSFDYQVGNARVGCNPRGYSRFYNISSNPQWTGLTTWLIDRPDPSSLLQPF